MKRRKIILLAGLSVTVLASGWLLLSSHRKSVEEAAVEKAAYTLRYGDTKQKAESKAALERLGPQAASVLSRQLEQREGMLVKLRHKISPIFPQSWRVRIRRVLRIRDPFVEKLSAIDGLGALGTNAEQAIPTLERALTDPQLTIVWAAASALARTGTNALPPLTRALQSTNAPTRTAGCYGLSLMKTNAAPAVSLLIGLLADADAGVRLAARNALMQIGEPALNSLPEAALSRNPLVRSNAVQVLRSGRSLAQPAIPQLIRACADEDPDTRAFASEALGQLSPWDPDAVAAFTHLLNDTNQDVRLAAARALERSGTRAAPALHRLTEMLSDPSPDIREAAAKAFRYTRSLERPIPPPLQDLMNDPVEAVRNAASNSLAALRGDRENARAR